MGVYMLKYFSIFLFSILVIGIVSCGGSDGGNSEPEVSEVKEFTTVSKVFVGEINKALAKKGEDIFKAKCTACHKYDTRLVGPPLGDVVKRRTPEYILSMITSPDKMVQSNDTAKALLQKYMTPMTNQNVSLEDAKAIFEHLRDISK